MNKLLVCAALGLVLAATETSAKKSCSSFKGEKCEKKGCDWSKTGDAQFKTCKEFAEDVAAPVVDTPVVQVDANVCSKFDTKRKCERKGCDWTKEGKRYKSCNDPAPGPSTNATADPTAEAARTAPDSVTWKTLPGCCRADGKQIKVLRKETFSGVNVTEADAMCANQCVDDLDCTAYEINKKKKKSKKNKSAQPKFICELHNSAIDSASKSTKSCRAAITTCNIYVSGRCPTAPLPLNDTVFFDAIADCLAEDPVGGNCVNVTHGPMACWDVSDVTDYLGTFEDANSFNGKIGRWNTSAGTTMEGMFSGASAFNQPIANWKTDAVTSLASMFFNARVFNQPINLDTSSVTTMEQMFAGAAAFNQPINLDTSSVTTMERMFYGATAFNQPITDLETGAVTTMKRMFEFAAAFNQPINDLKTGAVTTMESMFSFAAAFNQPIANWKTGAVTTMERMFAGAAAFNQPIASWKTGAVTKMERMFQSAAAFNQPIASWKTDGVTSFFEMFQGASEMLAKGCGVHSKPSAC